MPIETSKQPVTVEIEKLVYGGDALARVNGQVMMLPFALPGERVEVEPRRARSDFLRGGPLRVLAASPHRVAPRCEYFTQCGGCHYQHAAYEYQLEQKAAILRETLRRIGGIAFEGDIRRIGGEPWAYRNRIQLHFDHGNVGFRRPDSHDLCPITHCPIASPKLNQAIEVFVDAVKRREWPAFLQSLEIFTNETEVQLSVTETKKPVAVRFFSWCAEMIAGCLPGPMDYGAGGHTFRISRGSFFQVNRFLIDALVEEVTGGAAGETVADLYAGAGLFAMALQEKYVRVDAVERGTVAFRDLEWNTAAHAARIFPIHAATEDYLRELKQAPEHVVADPPRAGLGSGVTQELARLAVPRLTLVSCDPATLARDLKALLPVYAIDRLSMIDLFPQTFHFETVAHLSVKR